MKFTSIVIAAILGVGSVQAIPAASETGQSAVPATTTATGSDGDGCTDWPWMRANGLPCRKQGTATVDHSDEACPNWPWRRDGTPCSSGATPSPTGSFSEAKLAEDLHKPKCPIGVEGCADGPPKADKLVKKPATDDYMSQWRDEHVDPHIEPYLDDSNYFDNILPREKSSDVDEDLSHGRNDHITPHCRHDPACFDSILPREKSNENVDEGRAQKRSENFDDRRSQRCHAEKGSDFVRDVLGKRVVPARWVLRQPL